MTEIQGAPAGTQTGANGRYTLVVNSDGSINTSGGGGGGGGAVTVADGADVAQGTTSDASSALTVIGLLKNLKAALAAPTAPAAAAVANTTYTTVQVSPTGTAGTLIAADAARKVLGLRALAANTQSVWVGKATVTATTGMEFPPGSEKWFTGSDVPVALMQAISTSGTQVMVVTTGV